MATVLRSFQSKQVEQPRQREAADPGAPAPDKTDPNPPANVRQKKEGGAARRTRRNAANGRFEQTVSGSDLLQASAAVPKVTPQIPRPGILAERYQEFLHEWDQTHSLPQHRVYTPTFDLTALTLDAICQADEVYNRELSWLDFNWRVLYEAIDTRTPLLERLKFIAGIRLLNYTDLGPAERERLRDYFLREVYPILTPLAVDPGHPFPFISNLTLSLGVVLIDPGTGERQFARVKVPPSRPRWVPLEQQMHFLPLEQLIAAHLDTLFRGMEIVAVFPFRVTRNADLARNEEEADDLLDMISEELRERRFAPVVRLEIDAKVPSDILGLLQSQLHLENNDVYLVHGLLRRVDLFALADINLPHLKYEPYIPTAPSRLAGISSKGRPSELFNAIRQGDLLVHHPYHSFQSTTQLFVEAAARDPQVLAIKQTIYRTSDNSPIVAALIDAAGRGKQVAVLVEVKARFDEAKNVEWARKLEEAGCHVAYGLVGLKTHCKMSLAIRQEEEGLRAYYHVGTGNYNAKTSATYTDLGLLSCNPELGADLMDLFNYLTGYSYQVDYRRLLVAPVNMRQRFLE
ncbi:MAG: polyphosphate kinase, partial [Caldilinea sp.]|nr:polyphosphate kinase [Caldilinea sp.]